jgi:hypothetical protein
MEYALQTSSSLQDSNHITLFEIKIRKLERNIFRLNTNTNDTNT